MARKKRRSSNNRINWLTVAAAAILLSTFAVITLFNGGDWSQWLPDWETLLPHTAESIQGTPVTDDVQVHYIDVGQGDSMLIQSGKANILIDAGEKSSGDDVVSYLKQAGVTRLDLVVASHPHADHIGGMRTVIEAFDVGQVVMGDIPAELVPTSRTYTNLLKAIADKGLSITLAHAGDCLEVGDGTLSVLGPVAEYDDLNDTSLVMKYTYGDVSFLFTGDQEAGAEEDLVRSGADLSATVLKLGHHGSNTSSCDEFLQAVAASCAVIEVGTGNSYEHPHGETLERLEKIGMSVYRTDLYGNIVISTDGKVFSVETEKGES